MLDIARDKEFGKYELLKSSGMNVFVYHLANLTYFVIINMLIFISFLWIAKLNTEIIIFPILRYFILYFG